MQFPNLLWTFFLPCSCHADFDSALAAFAILRLCCDFLGLWRARRDPNSRPPCVDGSQLARKNFTFPHCWSVRPCVRPVDAVHMTAGHNALRGSGPDQFPAFDNAWGRWVVLTAGSTGSALRAVRPPNLHITPSTRRDRFTPQVRRVLCNARPWPSWPRPFWRSCSRARWRRLWSVGALTMLRATAGVWSRGSWRNGSRRARPP